MDSSFLTTLSTALVVAVGGVFSPGSALLTLFLLSNTEGLRRALSYYIGYFGAYSAMGMFLVWLSSHLHLSGAVSIDQSTVTSWISLAVGLLMWSFAYHTWRKPVAALLGPAKIFATLEGLGPGRLIMFGAIVSASNLKNLSIFLSAISVITEANLSIEDSVVIAVVSAWIFCLAVFIPILLFALWRSRAEPLLQLLRATIERHTRPLALGVLTFFGSLLLLRGVIRLWSP